MRNKTRGLAALGAALALGAGTLALTSGAAVAGVPAATSDHFTFTVLLFQSTTNPQFRIVSTSCQLTSTDESGTVPCALSASGTRDSQGGYTSSNLHVWSADGTIDGAFHLCACGTGSGSGVERDLLGPSNPVTLFGFLTSATTLSGVPVTDPNHLPDIERITFEMFVNDAA